MARRHPADQPGRSRLRLQMEHGLDARHPRLRRRGADQPALPPPPHDVLAGLRVHRELHPAAQPRRGSARQALAAAQDARRPLAAVREPQGPAGLHVGAPRQAAAVLRRRVRARATSGPSSTASTGGCSTTPSTAASSRPSRTSTRSYKERPALWQQDFSPSGFTWLSSDDADHNVFAFTRWSENGTPLVCVANFAGDPWEDFRLPLPLPADRAPRWNEVLNTDAEAVRRQRRRQHGPSPRRQRADVGPARARRAAAASAGSALAGAR